MPRGKAGSVLVDAFEAVLRSTGVADSTLCMGVQSVHVAITVLVLVALLLVKAWTFKAIIVGLLGAGAAFIAFKGCLITRLELRFADGCTFTTVDPFIWPFTDNVTHGHRMGLCVGVALAFFAAVPFVYRHRFNAPVWPW